MVDDTLTSVGYQVALHFKSNAVLIYVIPLIMDSSGRATDIPVAASAGC